MSKTEVDTVTEFFQDFKSDVKETNSARNEIKKERAFLEPRFQSERFHTSAIVGASSPAQLRQPQPATEITLGADEMEACNEVWFTPAAAARSRSRAALISNQSETRESGPGLPLLQSFGHPHVQQFAAGNQCVRQ